MYIDTISIYIIHAYSIYNNIYLICKRLTNIKKITGYKIICAYFKKIYPNIKIKNKNQHYNKLKFIQIIN